MATEKNSPLSKIIVQKRFQAITLTRFVFSVSGEAYLANQGIDDSEWGLWENLVALGSISLICLFLGYVQLRRIRKLK